MAGNKANTKTKGKEERGKASKVVTHTNEESEDVIDFAILRKPVPTSITGFGQARKIFDLATEELKDLLSNECDLLYECKVCRNIFRSLANFISHKRVYCKDKFNSSQHGHFINCTSMVNEMLQINDTEKSYQESLKAKPGPDSNDPDDCDERIPLTKDLTAVYEKITKSKGIFEGCAEPQVVLKKIPSSTVAVFQNVDFKDNKDKTADNMRTQVQELDTLLSRERAILQNDGKFIIESDRPTDPDNVIQISDDEDNDNADVLKCKICDLQFSTQKTLKFHMKYKHLESRLVYPCPDCLEIFSTSWSVYRHLFKVHRKTAAQIRRLRESIQSKAFRMNNPPAFYEKRKNIKPVPTPQISEEERRDQENQAWMDNMEGDGEGPRCGGCGRSFERRAALSAHTATCPPRCRALAAGRRPDAKKIEIQIRKDYNKGPFGLTILKPAEIDTKIPPNEAEATVKNENEKFENEKVENEKIEDDKDIDDAPMDLDEDEKSNDSADSPDKLNEVKLEDVKPIIRLPFALQAEKSNLAAFKQRIAADIDWTKILCKKCDTKHSSLLELYEHMADHVKWVRYACKLCNFKHYNFEKLPEHVKLVHKLKGDSDFYYSTVKAVDGKEAMIMSTCLAEPELIEETNNTNEVGTESRRPSRCSSDSSRLSDDSSSSSTLKETGSRKRKMYQNKSSGGKKKKDNNDDSEEQNDGDVNKVILNDNNNSSNKASFEENSSDLEDMEEKVSKRQGIEDIPMTHSRRPVRKRTKVKNADFEYDLSNLLKMEAQGYRESQSTTTTKVTPTLSLTMAKFTSTPSPRPSQPKKKALTEILSFIDSINQDCRGALLTLSRKSVENATAHIRTSNFAVYSTKEQRTNVFARPMLPRILSRGDKASPKKDMTEEPKDNSNSGSRQLSKTNEISSLKYNENNDTESAISSDKEDSKVMPKEDFKILLKSYSKKTNIDQSLKEINVPDKTDATNSGTPSGNNKSVGDDRTSGDIDMDAMETPKPSEIVENKPAPIEKSFSADAVTEKKKKCFAIPPGIKNNSVVPIKFRRQSLDLMKNPIINKNITELSKAGMKTKILVIKPINRNSDGARSINSQLTFQTIKFKDPNKGSSSKDKSSDQVMVVKIPKVPCTSDSDNVALTPVTTNSVANTSKNYETVKSCEKTEVAKLTPEDKIESVSKPNPLNQCDSTQSAETYANKSEESSSDKNDVVEKPANVVDSPKAIEISATS